MRMRTKGDGAKAAKAAIKSYERQIEEYDDERRRVKRSLDRAEDELEETFAAAAEALLPDAQPETVKRAAEELGLRSLVGRLKELHRQREAYGQRVEAIQQDRRYRERKERLAELEPALEARKEEVAALKKERRRFEKNKDLMWLLNREAHEERSFGAFQSFWRAVTLTGYREDGAKARASEALGLEDFESCVAAFEEAKAGLEEAVKQLRGLESKHDEVVHLVEERARLASFVKNFAAEAAAALQSEAASHLEESSDLELVHARVGRRARPLVAKAHALKEKRRYLKDLAKYLAREIADREARIKSIARVRRLWARRPAGLLSGDKTKWLVTVPEMKRTGAKKRVRWVKTMHKGFDDYDDYDEYSACMEHTDEFLAYDAFAMSADERMPYEGFTREVVPELDEWRDTHDQEKADYSELKEAIKAGDMPVEEPLEEGEGDGEGDGGLADAADAAAAAAGAAAAIAAADAMIDAEEAAAAEAS